MVFARYRQIAPFEMGVDGAEDVIDLVQRFQLAMPVTAHSKVETLHALEAAQAEAAGALTFFRDRFPDGGAAAEINEAETRLASLAEDLNQTRTAILAAVLSTVDAFLSDHAPSKTSPAVHCEIAGGLYQIVTSTTRTKPARDVQVE